MQELWCQGIGWDEEISAKELEIWQNWLQSLLQLSDIRIPRCYIVTKIPCESIQLHMFSDASEVAYSASAYVRITDDQSGIHCNFVMGKCRNSPIRRPTIPRLELLASVMAVRLSNLIRPEFDWKFDNIIFWTDSTTVLQYIYNESQRFHCFVATHLQEMHELTKPDQWRFVPGKLNPADDGSRGLPIEVFKAKCRWLSGPDFLHQSVDQWPCTTITKVLEEGKGGLTKQACQNVVAVDNGLSELLKRFSSWSKLQKCVAWLTRFAMFIQFKPNTLSCANQITLVEMKNSARAIVKLV